MLPPTEFSLPTKIDHKIVVVGVRHHTKAGEAYLDVRFVHPGGSIWQGSVPVTYRRTGLDARSAEECIPILQAAYDAMQPEAQAKWKADARAHWASFNKATTQPFFDVLLNNLGRWVCQGHQLPSNANWARRIQDIKELGYTLATDTGRLCAFCARSKTHLMLLPIPRGIETGYEVFSATLRKRILKVLGSVDAYEGKVLPQAALLPDHKFPEARWDADTPEENDDAMSESDIRAKFQLLTNQRNQQKREVCRKCVQTSTRGSAFGIDFFASGDKSWPSDVPIRGAGAEVGCRGCPWYDFAAWRQALNKRLR